MIKKNSSKKSGNKNLPVLLVSFLALLIPVLIFALKQNMDTRNLAASTSGIKCMNNSITAAACRGLTVGTVCLTKKDASGKLIYTAKCTKTGSPDPDTGRVPCGCTANAGACEPNGGICRSISSNMCNAWSRGLVLGGGGCNDGYVCCESDCYRKREGELCFGLDSRTYRNGVCTYVYDSNGNRGKLKCLSKQIAN